MSKCLRVGTLAVRTKLFMTSHLLLCSSLNGSGIDSVNSMMSGGCPTLYYYFVPSPSETWFQGMRVGGSSRRV